jgi:hypothetical protein
MSRRILGILTCLAWLPLGIGTLWSFAALRFDFPVAALRRSLAVTFGCAIDTSLPFAELKRRSFIDVRAKAADSAPDFSARIREGPGFAASAHNVSSPK